MSRLLRCAAAIFVLAGCEPSASSGAPADASRGVQDAARPEPPSPPEAGVESTLSPSQQAAIGSLDGLSAPMRRALSGKGFAPLPPPGPDDWRSAHPEPGQTFGQFAASGPNVPGGARRTLMLVPIGNVPDKGNAKPEALRAFAEAFFGMPVKLLPKINPAEGKVKSRTNPHTGKMQLYTPDILSFLQSRLPEDAFSLSAFTSEDLYPDEKWNYVFGQASLRERVGVFSFARYDPAFFGEPQKPGDDRMLELRTLKVMTHEAGHMFGIEHCIYFTCGMNGANHLEEADRWPLHLCPVCLRKLQHSVGFDVVKRYEALERYYTAAGLEEEAAWTRARLAEIRD